MPVKVDSEGGFDYQHAKWLIIYNKDYGELRKRDRCGGFSDLPDVETDAMNIKRGVLSLGAREEDIIMLKNVQRTEMMKKLQQINRECIAQFQMDGTNTLIFIYYAGHGIMNNYTEAVVNNNEAGNAKFRFPIERQMRIIATNPGTFVLGVLDCCRENFQLDTRGGGGGMDEV